MVEKAGKVWLVGAGPSDAGLMTLRGYDALQKAETVVYDHLLGSGILAMIPPSADKIYVGKDPGHHTMPQEQINEILIREASAGRRVVRLKGGDPFLFGRGGEELEALREQDIPCEVVPGVTSAVAVPAYAGIPVTHREYSSSLHIFTGHPSAGGSGLPDFSVLAKLDGTLVFLMGVSSAGAICKGLVRAGMPTDTPAAAIENGTAARQKAVRATLATLAEKMEEAAVRPPAVLVVGRTVSLADRLDWTSAMPLHGKRIVVTRPFDSCGKFCRQIGSLGGEVIAFPCLETVPDEEGGLQKAVQRMHRFTWIAFSSSTGVKAFFNALLRAGADARALAGAKVAAVGAVTAKCLRSYGIVPELVPEQFDSRHLGQELAKRVGPKDAVLVVRAKEGSRALEDELCRTGIPVETAVAYETVPAVRQEAPEVRNLIENEEFDQLTFASASAVRAFAGAFPGLNVSRCTAVCIGAETAAEAEKYGMHTVVSRIATMDGMLETLTGL